MSNKHEGTFRGFTYDGKEYIVYYNVLSRPHTVVINFPDAEYPIRVESKVIASSENEAGNFVTQGILEIPKENHFDWEKGWEFIVTPEHMLLKEIEHGDVVFLEPVDGFKWVKSNFIDLPNDIYEVKGITEFPDMTIVSLQQRYHRDNNSYKTKLVCWRKNGLVSYPTVTNYSSYIEDGGTITAEFEENNKTYKLTIPAWHKKGSDGKMLKPVLNSQEGISVYSDDERWMRLVEDFKKASKLKIHFKDTLADFDVEVKKSDETEDSEDSD
jgi:hypothetical protein